MWKMEEVKITNACKSLKENLRTFIKKALKVSTLKDDILLNLIERFMANKAKEQHATVS